MSKTDASENNIGSRWAVIIVVLIFLSFIGLISSLIIGLFITGADGQAIGNVAHISITGTIMTHGSSGIMGGGIADATEIIKLINKAEENPEVKAILIEINSPGGTAVASYELAQAIKDCKKTTVAWIREVGASGAYWAASAADYIIASPVSITGSIGVLASYIEFAGTLERYNASYRRLVSGDFKDMGSPLKRMTADEEEYMQESIDSLRDFFLADVISNRDLKENAVEAVSDARFFIGMDALKLDLIDQLGGKNDAISWIEKKENIEAQVAEYTRPRSLAERLTTAFDGDSILAALRMGSDMRISESNPIRT